MSGPTVSGQNKVHVTALQLKHLIETRCGKRSLETNRSFLDMYFSADDMLRLNQVLYDEFHHRAEILSIDTIEDVTRILTGNFDK